MPTYQAGGPVDTFGNLHDASARASYNRVNYGETDLEFREFLEPDELYGGESFFKYVGNEVNAVLDTMFCGHPLLTASYNPLYWILFAVLYLLLLPGAAFHLLIIGHVPVKKTEFPEERDLRGQGIYIALGTAIINLPFAIYGFADGQIMGQEVQLKVDNAMALLLSLTLIAANCIGLAAVSYGFRNTLTVYGYGCIAVVVFLIFMSMYAIGDAIEADDTAIIAVQYVTRVFLILDYTFIFYQVSYAVTALEAEDNVQKEISDFDWRFTYALLAMYSLFTACLITALVVADSLDWGLF